MKYNIILKMDATISEQFEVLMTYNLYIVQYNINEKLDLFKTDYEITLPHYITELDKIVFQINRRHKSYIIKLKPSISRWKYNGLNYEKRILKKNEIEYIKVIS
jgi:hypothetical protein